MPETNFFWDPLSDNILQERDETGTVTAQYTTEPGFYGNLVSQNRGGVESQYHFDALGSTLALTNDSQQITDTSAYTAFGELTEHTGTTENPFKYVGKKGYLLPETAHLTGVRRRDYDVDSGRWHSLDVIVNVNRYVYSLNDPMNVIDPSGTAPAEDVDMDVKPPIDTGEVCLTEGANKTLTINNKFEWNVPYSATEECFLDPADPGCPTEVPNPPLQYPIGERTCEITITYDFVGDTWEECVRFGNKLRIGIVRVKGKRTRKRYKKRCGPCRPAPERGIG